jgi:hypothetical protein
MTQFNLKPCPFCGGKAQMEEIDNLHDGVSFSVGCVADDEGACMGYQSLTCFSRRSEAAAAWNKRAVLDWKPWPADESEGILYQGVGHD